EYERLMHFVPEKDKELLSFPIRQNEIELILEFLRCLSLNQLEDFSVNLPAFFAKHSKIKLSALQNARTYDELLAALRKTGYYGALSRLAPGEGRQIDYNTIELVLWQNFYESFLSAIKENYTGETRSVLLSLIGSRLDIENISRVMRIKANFDIPPEELSSYLININYKVDLDFLKTLFEAQSEAEQLDLLRNSKYRYVFSKMDIRQIKGYSQDYLVETCRKAILRSAPSVYIGAVYLLLKEAEIINLIRIIESIRYGVEPKNILPI
ncbi:MAG: V-type ATPase subunit, partial [Bacillota bacterium]|nr:V-type ATPase subunit [Bacillota bacterium]